MHTLIAKLSALALLAAILLTAPASGRVPKAEIVFARFRGDSTGISAIRPGGQPRRLTRGSHWYPTWSPDRTKIAFVEFVNFEPSSLWVVDRDGGNERKLIDLFAGEYYRVGFDWSPDGSKLVYSDRIDGAGSFDLYVIDVETLETTKITSDESTDEEEPDWSPTSDEIVYHQGPKDDSVPRDDYDVYKVNSDGSNPTQLTTNEWADYSPMWSPDGSAIAFFSTRDDYHSESGPYLWELYIMQPDGGADRRLTEQATRKSNPAWSPDGDSIAYNSRCDDDVCGNDYDDNIYVVDVSSERLRKVTTKGQRSEDQPTWSPDSSWIAYVLHQRGGRSSDLFAVKVRNKRVKRVTSTRASGEGQIQWSSGRPGGTDL